MSGYILLIFLWVLYGVIHSVFAATKMKVLFQQYISGLAPYYRVIYVGFSVLLLIPVLMYQSSLPQRFLFTQHFLLVTAGLTLAAAGIMIMIVAFRYYDMKEFLGIRQLSGDPAGNDFQGSGILSYVRHPLYSGSILSVFGYFIFAPTIPNLIMGICLTGYFLVGIRFEEKKLIREYGERYIQYKKQVPALIPRLFNNP